MNKLVTIVAAAAWLLVALGAVHARTLIHAGTLLAVPGADPVSEQTVIVEDGKIVAVADGFVEPGEGDRLVDLSDDFVMPGLIDMHTHILFELTPQRKLEAMTMSDSAVAIRAATFARRTLEAGFTTIRNLGGTPESIFALRDGIAAGHIAGPRIIAAGAAVSALGGHGDISGYRQEIHELFASPTACSGPYDCRRAVRESVKRGADIIKIPATGGVLSDTATGLDQQLKDDELAEIVTTAHSLGRKVAAHAHGAGGINAALRAGVDSIEHGTLMNAESIALFKASGAWLVPTMLAGETVIQRVKEQNFLPPAIRDKALSLEPELRAHIQAAYEAGVKFAFGTDSGVSAHGDNAKEFLLMREIGMSGPEMLAAATVNAAELLGMSESLGTIEAGKAADIIATDGSPLADIAELLDVGFVMKGGRIYKGR